VGGRGAMYKKEKRRNTSHFARDNSRVTYLREKAGTKNYVQQSFGGIEEKQKYRERKQEK
jgi:hypothetical protein